MEKGKKRKRGSEFPRISYHTPSRTFDRLFKEDSLSEMKEIVMKKLGLGSDVLVQLFQIREGKVVDLEDDDDFDAFYALTRSTDLVNVLVKVASPNNEIAPSATSKLATADGSNKRDEFQIRDGGVSPSQQNHDRINSEGAAAETLPVLSEAIPDRHRQPGKKRTKFTDSGNSPRDAHCTRELTGPVLPVAPSSPPQEVEVYTTTPSPEKSDAASVRKRRRETVAQHPRVSQTATDSRQSEKRRKTIVQSITITSSLKGVSGTLLDAADNNGVVAQELLGSHNQPRCHQKKLETDVSQRSDEADHEHKMDSVLQKILAAKRMSEATLQTSPQQSSVSSAHSKRPKKKKKPTVVSDSGLAQDVGESCASQPSLTVGDSQHMCASLELQKPRPVGNLSICSLCLLSPSHNEEECPVALNNTGWMRKRLSALQLEANATEEQIQLMVKLRKLLKQGEKQRAILSAESQDERTDGTAEERSLEPPSFSVSAKPPLADIDLDTLIRGPKLRAADIRSPESSGDEQTQELEEDESESGQHVRTVSTSETSDESEHSSDDDVPYESLAQADGARSLAMGTDHVISRTIPQLGVGEASNASIDEEIGPALVPITTKSDARSSPQGTLTGALQPSMSSVSLAQSSSGETPSYPSWTKGVASSAALPTPPASETVMSHPPAISPTSTPGGYERKSRIITRMKSRIIRESNSMKSPSLPMVSLSSGYSTQHSPRSVTPNLVPDHAASVLPARLERYHRSTSSQDTPSEILDSTPFSAWVTLNPSSSTSADANLTTMIDELEPSSPLHQDVDVPNGVEKKDKSRDRSAKSSIPIVHAEIQPSQVEDAAQNGAVKDPTSNESDDENEVEAAVQQTKAKAKSKAAVKYRRLTEITSDHGLFSTPVNVRQAPSTATKSEQRVTDMYGRTGQDEIESESSSESEDSDAKEQSHIPKSRRAGGTRTRKK